MDESPAPGDVLITSERGRHFLSIVPHPHRLSMAEYRHALAIAKSWAAANNVGIWRVADGVVTLLPRDQA
jgi:hypothetical protein